MSLALANLVGQRDEGPGEEAEAGKRQQRADLVEPEAKPQAGRREAIRNCMRGRDRGALSGRWRERRRRQFPSTARSPMLSDTTISVSPSHPAMRPQFVGERRRDRLRRAFRLRMDRVHQKPSGRAVGLEVDARHDVFAEQERQAVIAEFPLVGRRVDLDAIAEIEQALGARALPDDGIERRQERLRIDAAGQWRRRVEIDRPAQPSTVTGSNSPASTSSGMRAFASAGSMRK